MNSSGTGAVFREWSNLASLITTALIYPAILVLAFVYPTPITLVGLLVGGVVLQVIVMILLHIAAAVLSRQEPDDERVVAIQRRASSPAGVVLGVGVFCVIGLTIVQGFVSPTEGPLLASPVLTGYALFAVVLVSELIRMSLIAVGFRRG
ncbi:MAG: hypothetical protein AB8F26_05130 [Phycisphaerales bacterium]